MLIEFSYTLIIFNRFCTSAFPFYYNSIWTFRNTALFFIVILVTGSAFQVKVFFIGATYTILPSSGMLYSEFMTMESVKEFYMAKCILFTFLTVITIIMTLVNILHIKAKKLQTNKNKDRIERMLFFYSFRCCLALIAFEFFFGMRLIAAVSGNQELGNYALEAYAYIFEIMYDKELSKRKVSINNNISSGINVKKTSILLPCKVCKTPTAECHYSVICCNSDKIFFRRYVTKGEFPECKDGDCSERNEVFKCRPCRYTMCLKAGMDPQEVFRRKAERAKHLQESLDNEKYNNIIRQNELHNIKLLESEDENNVIEIKDEDVIKQEYMEPVGKKVTSYKKQCLPLITEEYYIKKTNEYSHVIGRMFYIEKCYQLLRNHTFHFKKSSNISIYDLFNTPSTIGMIHRIDGESFRYGQTISKDVVYRHRLQDCLCLVVNYVKTLTFFQNLSFRDQKELMKAAAASSLMIDSCYYSYYENYNTIHCPDGFQPILLISPIRPIDKMVCVDLVTLFHKVQITPEEFCFLRVIVFCDQIPPEVTNDGKEIIRKEKIYQCNAFIFYLKQTLGIPAGPKRFNQIMNLLKEIKVFGNALKEYHMIELLIQGASKNAQKRELLPVTKYLMSL
uniref:Nuclear receptor n=1 Tax=Rhabditophanes sp. KR3021 TaxID=114890 RepID=A0AC35UDR5_9BILA